MSFGKQELKIAQHFLIKPIQTRCNNIIIISCLYIKEKHFWERYGNTRIFQIQIIQWIKCS